MRLLWFKYRYVFSLPQKSTVRGICGVSPGEERKATVGRIRKKGRGRRKKVRKVSVLCRDVTTFAWAFRITAKTVHRNGHQPTRASASD